MTSRKRGLEEGRQRRIRTREIPYHDPQGRFFGAESAVTASVTQPTTEIVDGEGSQGAWLCMWALERPLPFILESSQVLQTHPALHT